ncbi:hypothetical protein QTP88_009123 [Uroleucon formosanum]
MLKTYFLSIEKCPAIPIFFRKSIVAFFIQYFFKLKVNSFLMQLSGSNENVEKIFSDMNNLWTDDKSPCDVKTVKSMLVVKHFFTENCSELHDFLLENKKLLKHNTFIRKIFDKGVKNCIILNTQASTSNTCSELHCTIRIFLMLSNLPSQHYSINKNFVSCNNGLIVYQNILHPMNLNLLFKVGSINLIIFLTLNLLMTFELSCYPLDFA